jgi:hypothetical protein
MTNELNVSAVAVGAILSQGTTVTRAALNPTGGQLVLRDPRDRCAKIANTIRLLISSFWKML